MRGTGILPRTVVAVLLALLGLGTAWAEPALDAAAPPLVLTTLDGRAVDIARLQGKVVLVNYWATWCGPCRKEMPLLDSFYRAHHGEGLELIGISADHREDFARMRKVSAALAYQTTTIDRITDDGFGPPQGFPLTFVIDRQGVVRARMVDVDEALLRQLVLPLLAR